MMIRILRSLSVPLFLILLTTISVIYLLGVASIPFHPDESTYLYTSADFELFWQNPGKLFWQADQQQNPRQLYRELDAPITTILIGLGRHLIGLPALPADWDWSRTWAENQKAGALPSAGLLLAGRMSIAVLYPFSILFLFLAVRRAANDFTAWIAALLLATNALVLLHTRRAMAEGPLLFSATLCIWSLVKAEKRPWLTAIPAALAFCAKQTLAIFAPMGILAVLWPSQLSKGSFLSRQNILRVSGQVLLYTFLVVGIIFLLNPIFWSHPIPAIQDAIRARSNLAAAQAGDRPQQTLNTPGLKLIGMIGGLYMTPPIFAEVSNYADETNAAENSYMADPLNSLMRSIAGGGILFVVTLFGFMMGCIRAAHAKQPLQRRLVLLLAATVIQTLALLFLIPLPWQRYYMPLVPFACLWAAFGLDQLREAITQATQEARAAAAKPTAG